MPESLTHGYDSPAGHPGRRARPPWVRARRGGPQFLGQVAFIETLERLAIDAGAAFCEIVLLDSKPNALRRFADRTRLGGEPAHRDAQEMPDRSGGLSELEAMYDRLLSVLAARPAAAIVRTRHGEADAAYQDFLHKTDG